MSWFTLAPEIHSNILREVSSLEGVNGPQHWAQQIVPSLLVCRAWYKEITYFLTAEAPLSTLVAVAAESVVLIALQQRMLIPPQDHGYDTTTRALAEQISGYFVHAIRRGFVRCIHYILDHKSKAHFLALSREATFLHLAISSGRPQVLAALLERGVENIRICDSETETVPLEFAIKLKNVEMMEILLAHGSEILDATIPLERGQEKGFVNDRIEPLTFAALQNDLVFLRYLLDKGCAFSHEDDTGDEWNPLTSAIWNQNKEMITFLLDRGALINSEPYNIAFPLGVAAAKASADIVLLLLERGAEVNGRDEYGAVALRAAVRRGDESIVRLLLDHGAFIDRVSIEATLRGGGLPIAKLLMERLGREGKSMAHGALEHAASRGMQDFVELFLGCSLDPNTASGP